MEVAGALGLDDIRDARGLAGADFDHDGDVDLVMTLDCLHDMPRPDLAMSAIRGAIDPDGARSGFIGLQIHSGPPQEVAFRNLCIKEL